MDKAIRDQFNDSVLQELAQKFGAKCIKFIGGFESFVYEYKRQNRDYILRISHSSLHRAKDQISAEIDFVNYLAKNGAPVAAPIPSLSGEYLELATNTNPEFVGVSFTKAPGGHIQEEQWNPSFFEYYGQVMGQLHRLAKDYAPTDQAHRRSDCIDELTGFAEKHLPETEGAIIEKYDRHLDYLKSLPRCRDCFGLIHQDLHTSNFFVDDTGKMMIFDFDECTYMWFAADIAMTLFYTVPPNSTDKEVLERTRSFLQHFMTGYRRENLLDRRWLLEIPVFFKMRELALYAAIHRSLDLDNLNPWAARFMKGRKEHILKGSPYLNLDFDV